jgi:hypothetical protein
MHSHPGSTLIDNQAKSTRGDSVAIGDTVEAHSPGRLVRCCQYEVRLVLRGMGENDRFLNHGKSVTPRESSSNGVFEGHESAESVVFSEAGLDRIAVVGSCFVGSILVHG